ncbi:MAG: hypothetical protein LC659_10870, partial [Myxococcales bacterium]|nr:hypothetical protein [Myxococcales bacterium]
MRPSLLLLAAAAAGCAHPHDAEVVAAYEPRATIGQTFTADTTRLIGNGAPATSEEGAKALAALFSDHLAAVGQLRPVQSAGGPTVLVADLPAPGWALRVRITPKPELLCLVTIEPIATQPGEHAVDATPWSVQNAFETVRRRAPTLSPAKLPPMDAARFARLRAEAAAAAGEGRDPLLKPSEYVRVPRPISGEGSDAPYY